MIALILTTLITVDAHDDGRTIRAAKGATVVVRLEAQLGTGYGWQIRRLAKNLELLGEPGLEHRDRAGTTGGTDVQVFRFRVKSRAKSTLTMGYARPWDREKAPARTFSLFVDSR